MLPPNDIEAARELGLRCSVCRKVKKGAPWVTMGETKDLATAVSQALAESDYEVAVFVETDCGGFLYWTSKHPGSFNSDVIHQQSTS